MRTKIALLAVLALTSCGGDGTNEDQPQADATQTTDPAPVAVEIPVTAVEYEFQDVEDELISGETSFRLDNAGEEPHEFSLARITGDQPLEELLQLPEEEVGEFIEDAGRAFAEPGDSDFLEVELEPGRYGYVCFVEAPDGTPHAFLGMSGEFTVA
jgi:uncharacterized cupredoxin-like copper-binding protein